jgi:hypothetical protein
MLRYNQQAENENQSKQLPIYLPILTSDAKGNKENV